MTEPASNASRDPVALVTGGSRGIGRAVAAALLAEGYAVFLCARHQSSVDEACRSLAADPGGRVAGRACDVRRPGEVEELVEWAHREGGDRLDVLVNNAGLGVFGAVDEISLDDWQRTLETNLFGPFYAMRAAASRMAEQEDGGWIVNVASLAATNPFAGGAAYNASKFGLLGLSDAAMLDLRHRGVRVAAVLPGSVDTSFHEGRRPERDWMLRPEDVARAVVDLLRYPGRALPSRLELRPTKPRKG